MLTSDAYQIFLWLQINPCWYTHKVSSHVRKWWMTVNALSAPITLVLAPYQWRGQHSLSLRVNLAPRSPQHPAIRLLSGLKSRHLFVIVSPSNTCPSIRGWDWIVSMFVSLVCITGLRRSHLCSDVIRTWTYLFIASTSQIMCAGMESRWKSGVTRFFFCCCWLKQRSCLHLQNSLMTWMHMFLQTFNLSLRFETFSKTQ